MENIVGFLKDYLNCFATAILINLAILLRLLNSFSVEIDSSAIEGYCSDFLLQC